MNTQANFEKEIRQILKGKLKGFKTVGALGGGILGYGAGGSKGLYDAVKADREGEMEGLEGMDKAKEYLKRIMVPGAIGLGAGVGIGTGIGAAVRNIRPSIFKMREKNKYESRLRSLGSRITQSEIDASFPDYLKFRADDLEEVDLIKNIKEQLKAKLQKKTN